MAGGRVTGVVTPRGTLSAGKYCLCGGAWSADTAARMGVRLSIKPIRGQIALLNTGEPGLQRILNDGPRYLVPRGDGRVLVGSTEEDAGFVKQNTASAIGELLAFAQSLCPALGDARLERCWSGLRPGTADGLPYLGRLPDLENAFIAAGHFRQGLYLSPGTAVMMSQLLRGEKPEIDLTPFSVER
jgi:glycine oxidase